MDIAADSTGKADEQFAKYADTMEYKLNKLSTEWEKFKTSIIEEDDFKGAINGLTEFIKGLNNLDGTGFEKLTKVATGFGITIISITKSIDMLKASWKTTGASLQIMQPILTGGIVGDITSGASTKLPKILGYSDKLKDNTQEINKIQEKQNKVQGLIQKKGQQLYNLEAKRFDMAKRLSSSYNSNLDILKKTVKAIDTVEQKQGYLKTSRVKAGLGSVQRGLGDTLIADRNSFIPQAQQELGVSVNSRSDAVIQRATQLYREYLQELIKVNEEEGLREQQLNRLNQIQEKTNIAQSKATAEQQKYNQQLEKNAIAQANAAKIVNIASKSIGLLSSGLSSVATYLPMVAMGAMDMSTAVKMAGVQWGILAANQAIAIASTTVLNALKTAQNKLDVINILTTEALTEEKEKDLMATYGLTKAQIDQCAATAAEITANEGATVSFAKLAAAELGALGPLLIFVAIAGAVALATWGISKAISAYEKSQDKLLQTQLKLNEAEETAEKAREKAQTDRGKASSLSNEVKDAEELKKRYLELKDIADKTVEEKEEQKEIEDKIREQFPEIVLHYNEVTDQLTVQVELWEKIIAKQKESATIAAQQAYISSLEQVSAEGKRNQAQYEYDLVKMGTTSPDDLQNYYSRHSKHDMRGWLDYSWNGFDEGIHTELYRDAIEKNNQESITYYQEKIRQYFEDFFETDLDFIKHWKEATGKDLYEIDNFLEFLNGNNAKDIELYENWYEAEKKKIDNKFKESQKITEETIKNYTQAFLVQGGTSQAMAAIMSKNAKIVEDLNADNINIAAYGGTVSRDNIYSAKWGSLTNLGKDFWMKAGYTEETFNELSDSERTDKFKALLTAQQVEDEIGKYTNAFEKEQIDFITDLQEGEKVFSINEIKSHMIDPSYNEINMAYNKVLQDYINNLNVSIAEINDYYDDNLLKAAKSDTIASLKNATNNFKERFKDNEESSFQNFFERLMGASNNDLSIYTSALGAINNNIDNWNPFDTKAFEESLKKSFEKIQGITKAEVDKLYEETLASGKQNGFFNEDATVDQIEAFGTKAKAVLDVFADKGSNIQKYLKSNKELFDLDDATEIKQIRDFISKLEEVGVKNAHEILETNEKTRQTTLNITKLKDIQQKYGENAIEQIQEELSKEKAKQLTYEERIKKGETLNKDDEQLYAKSLAEIPVLQELVQLLIEADKYSKSMVDNFNTAEGQLSAMSSIVSSVSSALSNFQKNKFLGSKDIQALQDAFSPYGINANNFINSSLGLNDPQVLYKSAIEQLKKSLNSDVLTEDQIVQAKGYIAELYKDWIDYLQDVEDEQDKLKDKEEDIEEAKKKVLEQEEKVREKEESNEKERQDALDKIKDAEEDLVKAKQDYVDQLEVIEEKQEAINEAIEKYNELLYGSNNRASGLDIFYNYEQAISSLNDELSRSSDLLGKSETLNESIDALSKYTAATRNLIATERAKQFQIQAGLSSYSNMIERGSASYTNRETGELITVNFGEYAKKDNATGKYLLDQRLLNQASFNDEYKNLIEENIETYNKYVDEYNKIEDEITKKEKELQDKRKAAAKSYSEIEKDVAEALKEQYEEEVNNLKNKYNSMKEADEDYLSALEDAINKQKELRDREDKYEELAEQEKKLSLIQRDTSGSRQLDANKLKKDIEKTRRQLLDDAVNDVVEGLKKLAKENEETREVELQLKDAIISNTAHWNSQAQSITSSFTSASDYAGYMAELNPDFQGMTLTQQEVFIEEYKSQFAEALEYQTWSLLDATSETGDAIADTINVSTDQILAIVEEKTTTFSEEVIRAYNEITEKVSQDLENQEKEIDDARDALQDAIDKLAELSEKIDEAAQKIVDLQEEEEKANIKRLKELQEEKDKILELQEEVNKKNKEYLKEIQENQGIPAGVIPNSTNSIETITENIQNDEVPYTGHAQGMEGKTYKEIIENLNEAIKAEANTVRFSPYSNEPANEGRFESIKNQIDELFSVLPISNVGNYIKSYKDKYEAVGRELGLPVATYMLDRYAKGGLVDFTGPAWVDGTPSAPEAFLSAADTRAIGDAVKILSDLQILKDYDNLGQSINNTIGDTSIEINLNIENISSEIDIDNMLNRVKDEIVSVANPIGINTILKQR